MRRLEGDALSPIVGGDGVHRFDAAEVLAYAALRGSDGPDERAPALVETRLAEMLAASTEALKQSQEHVERLVQLVTAPAKELFAVMTSEMTAQRARVGELEAKNTAMLDANERALSQMQEREFARVAFENDEKRKSEEAAQRGRMKERAAEKLLDLAPPLLKQLSKKFGIEIPSPVASSVDPTPRVAGHATNVPDAMRERIGTAAFSVVANLVTSLTDEALQELESKGVLAPDQRADLEALRRFLKEPESDQDDAMTPVLLRCLAAIDDAKLQLLLNAGVLAPIEAIALVQMRRSFGATAPGEATRGPSS